MAETFTKWRVAPDEALRTLAVAFERTESARRLKVKASIADAEVGLRDAIDAARNAGVAWGAIADTLGIARGNAYQKYRQRRP